MKLVALCLLLAGAVTAHAADTPEPCGPLPEPRQIAWHELGYYGFVHFNMNTFTDREWGEGTEPPALFNPTALDCRQWAKTFKEAGMKGIIITAKHHDGFCLWPSQYTEHSVKNSPWRDGKGDLLQELADACKEYDLKFGVYLSPWDRNQPVYGDSPQYNQYFLNQLEEILPTYADVFEVWFDGACGEGPNGKRQVYDWPAFVAQVRKYAPNAVIFSDAGPDIRWVGNEGGDSSETTWAPMRRDEFYPGIPGKNRELGEGHIDGTHWLPPEVDVSIRPGWYYHAAEDERQKSVERLMQIYYNSWGNNGSLLLNIPVDRRGLVHENDARRLMEFKAARDAVFAENLALDQPVLASNTRGGDPHFAPHYAVDGNPDTYWAADDGLTSAWLELKLDKPTPINHFLAQEFIPLGQRIKQFHLMVRIDGTWRRVAEGTTIGNRKVVRFPTVVADTVRFVISDALACPTIRNLELYAAPPVVEIQVENTTSTQPVLVTLTSDNPQADIVYTLDGKDPDAFGIVYQQPFTLHRTATVKARAFFRGRGSIAPAEASLRVLQSADFLPPVVFVRPPDPGLAFQYFEGGWQSLSDMGRVEPVLLGTTPQIDLEMRKRDEHFAITFHGFISAPETGLYSFFLASDDGSRLFIHDQTVIDHDGLHGMDEKSAEIPLRAGYHPVKLQYFNATGGKGLKLEWAGPGFPRTTLAPELLSH